MQGWGFVHRAIPAGATAMVTMVPAATLPAAPGTTACTGTSTVSSPGRMVPSSKVSKRTSPVVMHTVPWGIVLLSWAVSPAVNRTTPWALRACLRSSPRKKAWQSRASPWAVWGKA